MSRITDIAQEMKTWWSNEGSDIQVQSALDEIIRIDQERVEQTEPNSSEKPNNCEECKWWFGYCHLEECEFEPKDETRFTAKCLNCVNGSSYKCSKCDGEMYFKDEPQTERSE